MDSSLWGVASEVLSHDTTSSILGIMFVIAIFVGAVLDDGGRDLLKWTFAVLLFAIFATWSAYVYANEEFGFARDQFAIYFGVITFTIYSVGLAIGWSAISLGKYSYHNSLKQIFAKFKCKFLGR
jgi:hypothetical protein